MIYQTLDIKLGINSGAPEGLVVPAPHVTPLALLLTIWTSFDMEIVLDTKLNTNNNKTWTPYKTKGSRDESNIIFTRKS